MVGHNGINNALIAVITGKKYDQIKDIEYQYNTSVNIFEIDAVLERLRISRAAGLRRTAFVGRCGETLQGNRQERGSEY